LNVDFVTPWAGTVVVVAVLPVAAAVRARRRATAVRAVLGLPRPPRSGTPVTLAALVLTLSLLALAAAQPVVASHDRSTVPHDADVFVVIDTSRSMLAAPGRGRPTRFERATAIARALRAAVPTAAVGIASLTDRLLPHLFPTQDRADFDLTLAQAIAVQRPPPAENVRGSGTALAALGDLAAGRFFASTSRTRIAVVLTDGESRPFEARPVAAALSRAHVQPFLLRLGSGSERVYGPGGKPESYRPQREAGIELARVAAALGATAYDEPAAGTAVEDVADAVAHGAGRESLETASVRSLSPYLAFAALLPLGLALVRRNLR
jgi:hypothetical protein